MYYARIKKTSEYADQDNGTPFPIELNTNLSYILDGFIWHGGPGGNYRQKDLDLYVENHEGKIVKIPQQR